MRQSHTAGDRILKVNDDTVISWADFTRVIRSHPSEPVSILAERAGRVLGREQLIDLVRGSAEESFDRSIDVHVSHLRQKLGDDPRNPRLLKTVRGVGYMLAVAE